MTDWIEVFRTGTWTSSQGDTKRWTEADLDTIVAATHAHVGNAGHEAPAVIGHPSTDAPAYGWVSDIKRVGDRLVVRFRDLVPEFVDMVRRHMFPNRSVALNADHSLRHVGFLGAKPPAVKGLAPIALAATTPLAVIEFAAAKEDDPMPETKTFKEKLLAFFGLAEELGAEVTIPGVTKPGTAATTFTQADVDAALARGREEGKKTTTDELATQRRTAAVAANKAAAVAFCAGLKSKGQVLPAWEKAGLATFLQQLAELGGETTYTFAEGADAPKLTPLAWMQSFLEGLPKVVNFEEVARAEKGREGATAAETIKTRCFAEMAKDPQLTYDVAFTRVTTADRALAERYLIEARG